MERKNLGTIRALFVALILLICPMAKVSAIQLEQLKGTYDILKPEFALCSPLYGALWWETGLIKRYYLFGNSGEKKKVAEEAATPSTPQEVGDATIKLIQQLFHTVQGSFGVSALPTLPAAYFSARTIGKIIGWLEKQRLLSVQQGSLKKIPARLFDVVKLTDLIRSDADFDASLKSAKTAEERKAALNARSRVSSFSSLIVAAAQESSGGQPKYPPATVYEILLAFLHKKASTKEQLEGYFNAVNEQVETVPGQTGIFADGKIPAAWKTTNFDAQQDVADTIAILEKMPLSQEGLSQLPSLENIVYAEVTKDYYQASLPNLVEYAADGVLLDTVPDSKITFADCMETTIRNLCNIATYNEDTGIFEAPAKADALLREFYADEINGKAINVGKKPVHQAWVKVVENRPYVSYVKIVDKKTCAHTKAPEDYAGFIHIPGLNDTKLAQLNPVKANITIGATTESFYQVTVSGAGYANYVPKIYYVLTDEQAERFYLYEVNTTLKNVVVLLSTLLGLNLFADKDMSEEFFNPQFNATYFPLMCEKLEWELSGHAQSKILDAQDYSSHGGQYGLNSKGNSFTVTLSQSHGKASKQEDPQARPSYKNFLFNNALNTLTKQPAAAESVKDLVMLSLYRSEDTDTFEENLASVSNVPWLRRHLYFVRDLVNNTDIKMDGIKKILSDSVVPNGMIIASKLIVTVPIAEDVVYPEQVVEIVAQADKRQDPAIKKAIDSLIEKVNSLSGKATLFTELVTLNFSDYNKQAIEAADAAVNSAENNEARSAGIELFRALFGKKQGFSEAIAAVTTAMNSEDYDVQHSGLKLFGELVEKGQVFTEAIEAADLAVKSKDPGVQLSGLELFGKLVEKGQGFTEAVAAAEKVVKSKYTDSLVRYLGKRLLEIWKIKKQQEKQTKKAQGNYHS